MGEIASVCSDRVHALHQALAAIESIAGHAMRAEVHPAFVQGNTVKPLYGIPNQVSLTGQRESAALEESLRWMREPG